MEYTGKIFMLTDAIPRKYIHAHRWNNQEIYSRSQIKYPGNIFMLTHGIPRKYIHAHR
jgi:hypothetical protein